MSLRMEITKKLHSSLLDVSLDIPDGHIGLLGESGSGKSMTLKCIAGIEKPDSGVIEINGRIVYDSARGINLPPQERHTGYLFQNYALFPHVSAWRNIELILPRSVSGKHRRETAMKYLDLFGLSDIAHCLPVYISGGQQQRLALARLLASNPSLVLLDEPFSALDTSIKARIEEELTIRLKDYSGTVILVTHNRDEAYRMCDNLVILHDGHVVERGLTKELFSSCRTQIGAKITGCSNIAKAFKTGSTCIAVPDWGLLLETNRTVPDETQYAGIRSHHIRKREKGDEVNCVDFEIVNRTVSPYTVADRIVALTPAGFAGGERDRRLSLIREYALSGEHIPGNTTRELLHIPPERIQLLT